jgi:hypothetical protein
MKDDGKRTCQQACTQYSHQKDTPLHKTTLYVLRCKT